MFVLNLQRFTHVSTYVHDIVSVSLNDDDILDIVFNRHDNIYVTMEKIRGEFSGYSKRNIISWISQILYHNLHFNTCIDEDILIDLLRKHIASISNNSGDKNG